MFQRTNVVTGALPTQNCLRMVNWMQTKKLKLEIISLTLVLEEKMAELTAELAEQMAQGEVLDQQIRENLYKVGLGV